jgi:peptidoglycan hydrolase CwlO-like protein
MQNIENTLKKMGLVLEKLVQKVDELDKRVKNIEEKLVEKKEFSSSDFKTQPASQTSSSSASGFGSSFLGSLTGTMAGMGLYNLLFNHSVTPAQFGHEIGLDDKEIDELLNKEFDEIDSKLDEIDSKLEELDEKIENISNEDVMQNDYFEDYEAEDDLDFYGGVDDFGGDDF